MHNMMHSFAGFLPEWRLLQLSSQYFWVRHEQKHLPATIWPGICASSVCQILNEVIHEFRGIAVNKCLITFWRRLCSEALFFLDVYLFVPRYRSPFWSYCGGTWSADTLTVVYFVSIILNENVVSTWFMTQWFDVSHNNHVMIGTSVHRYILCTHTLYILSTHITCSRVVISDLILV